MTGDDGVAVTLTEKPDKIVSLTPAETEVLYAIGAGDSVAGKVEDIANFPPEAKAVPVVSSFGATGLDVDTEKIVGLGTDLVIAGGEGGTPQDAIDKLRSLKIPVLVLYAPDVNGVYQDIAATGDAVGESDKADALVLVDEEPLRPGGAGRVGADEAAGVLRNGRPAVDLRDRPDTRSTSR